MLSLPGSAASLSGIVLLSVALRLIAALYQGNAVETLPGIHDQVSYHALACRVVDGHGFSFATDWWPATKAGKPTAHWSYLYTLYLVLVYWLFGVNPLAARLIQSFAVGIMHPWISWRIGNRLGGNRVGLTAALIAAVYGYFVYYAGALMTESFYVLAILWTMDIATRLASPGFSESGPPRIAWIFLGIAIGTAILLRQVFMFFVPFLVGWLVYVLARNDRRVSGRRLASGILTVCLAAALMIAPWTVRNYFAFGKFVLLNTNAGFAFFWGNHPVHGRNFVPVLRDQEASYGGLIPHELRNLDEASLDRELLRKGVSYVVRDPRRYVWLSLSRAKEYFKFWPSAESSLASNLVRTLSFGLLCPFIALGLVVRFAPLFRPSAQGWRGHNFSGDCHLLLLLFVVIYTAIHLLTWTLIRYRLPVDAILVFYAAAGVTWLLDRMPVVRCAQPTNMETGP